MPPRSRSTPSARCDVSVSAGTQAAVAACVARFGRLDVLVNNAGVIDLRASSEVDTALGEFRALLAVNLLGAQRLACEAADVMRGRSGGVVINLASAGGFVASPLRPGYGASKAAIMAMTGALSGEWTPFGVRVNAVAPGYILTEMLEGLVASGKVNQSAVAARIPLGRLGRPSEIAEVIHFIASDASASISGTTVIADGGFLAVGGARAPSTGPAPPRGARHGPRSVVVTGATSELGRQIATFHIARGDRVILYDDDAEGLESARRAIGGECLAAFGRRDRRGRA